MTAVNDNGLAPGLVMRFCGDRPNPSMFDEAQKTDVALYRKEVVVADDERAPWGDQILPVVFTASNLVSDTYHDTPVRNSSKTVAMRKMTWQGQSLAYGEFLMAVQQRLAVFMLVIIGRQCRFIRWDRSGSIVTSALDYFVDWVSFCHIMSAIAFCTDVELGCDPTAVRLFPHDPDYHKMNEAAVPLLTDIDHAEGLLPGGMVPEASSVLKYVRHQFASSLEPLWPRYRLEVPDGNFKMRCFLVCKPVFRAEGLAGRGTRGYVALDCETGAFVWLKDAWREHHLMVEKEGDVLAQLNDAGIPHVPTLVCHGDIGDQDTLTPVWWEQHHRQRSLGRSTINAAGASSGRTQPSGCSSRNLKRKRAATNEGADITATSHTDCPLRLHRHYRLVVKEVAMPLSDFTSGRQLVSVVTDCIYGEPCYSCDAH